VLNGVKEAGMIARYFMGLKFILVVLVGGFFLLGSFGPSGGGSLPAQKQDPSQLPPDKRKEYNELQKKRDYAKQSRERRYDEYWKKRDKEVGEYKSELEKRVFDGGVKQGEYSEYGHTYATVKEPPKTIIGTIFILEDRETKLERVPIKQGPGAHDLHNEITKIDKHVKQIDKQMDDLLKETQRTCFPPDTLVLLGDGTYKAIKDIKAGDMVSTYDIAKDAISSSNVKEVSISENNHFYQINGAIKATAYERFFTQDGWKKIRELKVGDSIFDGNGFEEITQITKEEVGSTVYNLSINSSYNFFVSHDGNANMLVHNSGGGGGGGSGGGSGGGK
jgi:hypothetical protein